MSGERPAPTASGPRIRARPRGPGRAPSLPRSPGSRGARRRQAAPPPQPLAGAASSSVLPAFIDPTAQAPDDVLPAFIDPAAQAPAPAAKDAAIPAFFDPAAPPPLEAAAPAPVAPPPRMAPGAAVPVNLGPIVRPVLKGLALAALLLLGAFLVASPWANLRIRGQWLRAEFGSTKEAVNLAWRYRAGDGLRQNYAKAAAWFASAAARGDREAQYDEAVLLYYGLGVPSDAAKAEALLERSAALKYAPASTLLGIIENERLPGSAKALEEWAQAAAQGDPWAESLLGSAYLAQRDDKDETLILALYWMEAARRDGVEPVGGQLQHVWATVAADRLEGVTSEVFRRLQARSPAPLTAAEQLQLEEERATAEGQASSMVDSNLVNQASGALADQDEVVAVQALIDEKTQEDSKWGDTDEGSAVTGYLANMRDDVSTVEIAKADDGTETLTYRISGEKATEDGVDIVRLRNDINYRSTVIESVCRKIVQGAVRPPGLDALLEASRKKKGDASK